MKAKTGNKGYALEELLRAYFIRAGVYAVRSVPLRIDGDELTDIDIWLYERPTGSSRRRQIVDAKSKNRPKAIERLLWTKGLYELLAVDGAYIATTDTRPLLGEMARRLSLSVLDGTDLKRMANSEKVMLPNRLSEEDLDGLIKAIDKSRKNKNLQNSYIDLKAALVENFGAATVNRALEHACHFSAALGTCHPNSQASEALLRLFYISASICCIALDYSITKVSFKSAEERRKTILNVIRYGEENEERGLEKVRIATALIEKYAQNGRAVAQSVAQSIRDDYARIPAEIIADHILKHLKSGSLFRLARSFELRAYSKELLGFDDLSTEEKSMIGILLDFSNIERASIANKWKSSPSAKDASILIDEATIDDIGPLFEASKASESK